MRYLLTLTLSGNFCLHDEEGEEIPIRLSRVRALLAILALSRDKKRSRSWLQTCLWERSPEDQASASLRQALSELRKNLGPYGELLITDRAHVSMPALRLAPGSEAAGASFFEDAPTLGEVFEEWLRLERSRGDDRPIYIDHSAASLSKPQRYCLVLTQPQTTSTDPMMPVVSQVICDRIQSALSAHGLVDIFDLRDLSSNQLGQYPLAAPPRPDAVLQIKGVSLSADRHLTMNLTNPATHKVLWTHSSKMDVPMAGVPPTEEWIQELTGNAVDAIHATIFSTELAQARRGALPEYLRLFSASHQLMSASLLGLEGARALLSQHVSEGRASGLTHAWYAFSFANSVGERGELEFNFSELVQENCARAVEKDPTNGLVLALVAHAYGFILRRLEAASEFAALARRAGPDMPLVWDLSAMNAIYRDDPESGHEFSLIAQRLGKFSPYKPLYDSSVSISATLTGRHQLAITTAESLLQRQSGFLAAMRYLAASLIEDGRIGRAREMIADIQARDPEFSATSVLSTDYPLPSDRSREVIAAALAKV